MKVILGTSIVPTTIVVFIILFVTLGISLTISLPQFVYAQTMENKIIENTLDKVEEATQEISETTNPLNNIPKATDSNTSTTSDKSKFHLNQRSEYKIYESNAIGVKFTIPSTWEILEFNSTKGCFEGEPDPIFLTTFSCSIRLDNNKVSSLYPHDFEFIIGKDSTSNYSLTDYLSLLYESTEHQAIKNQVDVSFINDKEMTIQNNLPAWQIEYSINSGIGQYKQMDIVTKLNNTFYGITYLQMNPSDYSKYLQNLRILLSQ
jgi:hypothetical protein